MRNAENANPEDEVMSPIKEVLSFMEQVSVPTKELSSPLDLVALLSPTLSPREVADGLNVKPDTARRWIVAGKIKAMSLVRPGSRPRYSMPPFEFRRMLEERRPHYAPEPGRPEGLPNCVNAASNSKCPSIGAPEQEVP